MEKKPHILNFRADGTLDTIYTDKLELSQFGPVTKTRASHIRPLLPPLMVAFCLLRGLFGDNGRVAAWTRTWRGPWRVTICRAGAPPAASFTAPTRAECIEWEINQLNK